ncbi:MAG: peptide chain release factor N(5)-glutamine methyltransferase [Gemmatimonadetes bacterium]|nr:peptide chain release factor N(5)-glutamine methyltransferase [Gemmatimonadota bacterium]
MTETKRWTPIDLLKTTAAFFESKGLENARVDAEILLSHVLQCRRIELYAGFERALETAEVNRYREMVRARAKGEPVQRITGEAEFYGLGMTIQPGVFIPRPETELLIDEARNLIPAEWEGEWRACDVCTGTGIIPVTLLSKSPAFVRFDAVDASEEAIENAGVNAERHGVLDRLERIHSPLGVYLRDHRDTYRLLTANPPYVMTKEIATLAAEVREYDPALALDGGADGLDVYRELIPLAYDALLPGGALLLEISDGVSAGIRSILGESAFGETRVRKDYGGHDRVLLAKKEA